METHERLYEVLSHDLVAWARRGDDARMTEFTSGIAAIWAAVDADQMAKARELMDRLIGRRNEDLPAELAEARAIMADRAANWTEMRDAVQHGLKLDGNQLGAINAILSRVLGDETVVVWLDEYRGLGFEELLRREATPEELACCVPADTWGCCWPTKEGNAEVVED